MMEASATHRESGLEQPDARWMRSLSRRLWLGLSGAWAVTIGLLPHVLHHAGPLAGAALFAGVGGSLLFGAVGLLVAVPFLRRMHRRFGTWRAPAIALALFALVFSISTFVIGPAIGGDEGASGTTTPAGQPTAPSGHEAHHD